ncbi:MAG: hypothetical protein WCL61_03250 [bacterium]
MPEIKKQMGGESFSYTSHTEDAGHYLEEVNEGIDKISVMRKNLESLIGGGDVLDRVLDVVSTLTVSFPDLDLTGADYDRFIEVLQGMGDDVLTESSGDNLLFMIGSELGVDTEALFNKKAA